jgi:hypothetical protein
MDVKARTVNAMPLSLLFLEPRRASLPACFQRKGAAPTILVMAQVLGELQLPLWTLFR